LPPTQYLVMEVLAARHRLGENAWTFPSRLRPALGALSGLGLLWWKWATIPDHCLAGLTDAGRSSALSPTYQPPASKAGGTETEWGVRRPDLASGVRNCGSDGDSEQFARFIAAGQEKRGITGALVRRTVTYGPWEEGDGDG